jgi:molybdopterin-guanine dinucleotide biosynthesis protein A
MNHHLFTGFVLAGGKSSRMGKDKYSLEIGGETFLARAVNVLTPVCEAVKIVLNEEQTIDTSRPVVRDIFARRGALGAIHAALTGCANKFALILAVDLPLVSAEALENLENIALSSNKYIAFVPRQTNHRAQPLCAVYRAKYCLPALEKLLAENDSASVSDFLDLIFPKYIDAERLSADENLLFNVNSPADLSKVPAF